MTVVNYIGVIKKTECAGYYITFPDFPEYSMSHGGSLDLVIKEAHNALQFFVEVILESKKVLPEPMNLDGLSPDGTVYFIIPVIVKRESIRINISMDKNLLEQLDETCLEVGMTRSGYIAESVRKLMLHQEKLK